MDDLLASDISKAIAEARVISGYTQKGLGEIMGVSTSMVAKWERANDMQVSSVIRIERALGVEAGFIFRRAGLITEATSARSAIASDPLLDEVAAELVIDWYDITVSRTAKRRAKTE